jgi:hypothetical protein
MIGESQVNCKSPEAEADGIRTPPAGALCARAGVLMFLPALAAGFAEKPLNDLVLKMLGVVASERDSRTT